MATIEDRRTTAQPLVVAGVTFECFHAGVLRYVWRSEDGRIEVARNAGNATTYRASVDGKPIASPRPCADGQGTPKAKRFMTQRAAMEAAVKAATLAGPFGPRDSGPLALIDDATVDRRLNEMRKAKS